MTQGAKREGAERVAEIKAQRLALFQRRSPTGDYETLQKVELQPGVIIAGEAQERLAWTRADVLCFRGGVDSPGPTPLTVQEDRDGTSRTADALLAFLDAASVGEDACGPWEIVWMTRAEVTERAFRWASRVTADDEAHAHEVAAAITGNPCKCTQCTNETIARFVGMAKKVGGLS